MENAEQLVKLIRKKATAKSRSTRFLTYLEACETPVNIDDVQLRLDLQVENYKYLEQIFDDITELSEEDNVNNILEERFAYEDVHIRLVCQAKQLIRESTPVPVSMTTGTPPSSQSPPPSTSSSEAVSATKTKRLPIIGLPVFSGGISEWLNFYDMFNSLINKDNTLSDVERFFYLKSCLRGDAANVIQSLTICESNYSVAWSMLRKQFENKSVIIQTHLKQLFQLPVVTENSATSIRNYLNQFLINVRALQALENEPSADSLLIYLAISKLDSISKDKWSEIIASDKNQPKLDNLTEFLTNRCTVLETRSLSSDGAKSKPVSTRPGSFTNVATYQNCVLCKETHKLYQCDQYLKLNTNQRWRAVREANLCFNCLGKGHGVQKCKSRQCYKCNEWHNSTLHPMNAGSNGQRDNTATSSNQRSSPAQNTGAANTMDLRTTSQPSRSTTLNSQIGHSQVMLSTVIINIIGASGQVYSARALIDSGSQSHIMTTKLANELGLPQRKLHIPVIGVGGAETNIRGQVKSRIFSRLTPYEADLNFLVMDHITQNMPYATLDPRLFNIPQNLPLADPHFYESSEVDILLGCEIFYDLMCAGQLHPNKCGTVLQETLLGYVVAGRCSFPVAVNHVLHLTTHDLCEQMKKFWEIEDVDNNTPVISDSERHFSETVRRDNTGRFTVKLPFNEHFGELGESYQQAVKRFQAVERRLGRDSDLREQYISFMEQYVALDHMTACDDDDISGYYLPHHAVIKENSSTTKCRIVFDASAKTTSGVSLNDTLHVGPVVQDDLFSILLRFRKHAVVITGDIEKMYRQILVAPEDRKYQQIVWRASPDDELRRYKLNTVTYGTASAPFAATRCLRHLAELEENDFPNEAKVIRDSFYVDDLITGCESMEIARELKDTLVQLLKRGGFNLVKWRSNVPSLMDTSVDTPVVLNKSTMNTLGLLWNYRLDSLQYSAIPPGAAGDKITKRSILSDISKLFDPCGLVGPIIITGKILLQTLWKEKVDWDTPVPEDISTTWTRYRQELQQVETISIPRRVADLSPDTQVQLIGFCDASERAYGCAIYIRTTSARETTVRLLCAKSRVSPVRQVSIPRLELLGALLLSQLVQKVEAAMQIKFSAKYLWCDSTIVLAWIASQSTQWNTFVANRVSEIQRLTSECRWSHVRTHLNPADIISRGESPSDLASNKLWFNGPDYLLLPEEQWPTLDETIDISECPEGRKIVNQVLVQVFEPESILTRFSSWNKLRKVMAYCYRFIHNCRSKNRNYGPLSAAEVTSASTRIIICVQQAAFKEELLSLKRKEPIHRSSRIRSLDPFIHADGLLRVGGRLRNATLPFQQQHPTILPSKNHITELIINYEHLRHFHAGPTAVLAAIRTRYWPIAGKSTVKKIIRSCVRCCRARPTPVQHIMGSLPSSRVTPIRPFSTSGVDFCGPFFVSSSHKRGARKTKAYVAVFICFATKAAHLELVGDLTTESCLGALKRFIARRGLVAHIYSDNGTNLVGSNNELKQLAKLFRNSEPQLASLNIQWHFAPVRSPHFQGLCEAGVKSAKHHLKRVAALASLTFEELSTVLAQVEACMNSRPLTPMSEDINDMTALTPGHFLIGDALTTYPEGDLTDIPVNRLSHWQRVQQITKDFWKRWQQEYLTQQQQRSKWKQQQNPLQLGALVTVRDDNQPPLRWKLGRVIELHPGEDGVVRVVSVKTMTATTRLSVTRLCVIPVVV